MGLNITGGASQTAQGGDMLEEVQQHPPADGGRGGDVRRQTKRDDRRAAGLLMDKNLNFLVVTKHHVC